MGAGMEAVVLGVEEKEARMEGQKVGSTVGN